MKQGSDNHTRNTICAPKQWRIIVALIVLTSWACVDQSFIAYASDEAEITAEEIVERADHIRFPVEGYQVDVKITTTRPDNDPVVKEYRVLSKGKDRSVLMTTAPAIDRGNILLMRDQGLWAFLPNLSQPIRIPLAQKLTGEVANGDLARANFAGDYKATLLHNEKIGDDDYYVLELLASRRGVTYHRVVYWVNQSNYRPWKAEFYSRSNRLIKTCIYKGYKKSLGTVRPTQLVMEDALRKDNRSVLDYNNMQTRKLPDKVFTKDYLKKLSK